MTSGSPLRLILVFMIPLLLGNLFQQFYNIVDAMIVGRLLGADALAAVGSSSSVQFLVLGFCMGSCAGFGIPVSQRFGAEDMQGLRRYVYHSLVVTTIIAAVLTTLTALLCPLIMHIMQTPEDIYQDAYQYLLIIFLGIPFTLLYNLLSSLLRAVGNSKAPFIFLAISTFLNVFLDLFCIAVLHLGCAGAALATITAQALSGIACLVYIIRVMPVLHPTREDCHWNSTVARNLVVMGLPMGLQYSVTAIGSMVMQSANNGLGSIYVSGFTAGTKVKQLMLCPFDAVATAMATFVGQNMGAHKMDRVKQGIRVTLALAVGYGIVAGVIMNFGGHFLGSLFGQCLGYRRSCPVYGRAWHPLLAARHPRRHTLRDPEPRLQCTVRDQWCPRDGRPYPRRDDLRPALRLQRHLLDRPGRLARRLRLPHPDASAPHSQG